MLPWALGYTYLFQPPFFSSFAYNRGVELLGHMVILSFLRNCHTIFYGLQQGCCLTFSLAMSLHAFFLTYFPALTTTQSVLYFIYIPHLLPAAPTPRL